MKQSILTEHIITSPLKGQSVLKPKGWGANKTFIFSLSLTSLIDAFSILVIYLLMNFGATSEPINVAKNIELPTAAQSDIIETGPIVQISSGHYIINDKEIPLSQITRALIQLREKENPKSLIIQADRHLDFVELSPVIQAGSHAGFEKFKFAVMQEGMGR